MEKMTFTRFVFETPLYQVIKWEEGDDRQVEDIFYFEGKIDGPCIHCGKSTTFTSTNGRPYYGDDILSRTGELKFRQLELICGRDDLHKVVVYCIMYPEELKYQKVGQYPSIASLAEGEISRYKKILDRRFKEFSKAIGLASHGVGIGSFVYLRRIFENLIEEAHSQSVHEGGWDESLYNSARMDEKISLLSHKLPNFLVENRNLYGILSKGIHELSENECLDIFPVVKLGIELILDEKIMQKEQAEKIKATNLTLQKIAGGMKSQKK